MSTLARFLPPLAAAAIATAAIVPAAATAGTAPRASVTVQVETAAGPVTGASVRLLAAGARSATVVSRARTGSDGSVAIRYRTPAAGTPLYVVADGGSVGGRALPRGVRLLSIAGRAGATPATVHVEERSTVAGAYAFARFIDGAQISGPSPGMPNATASAANLYEAGAGKVSFVVSNPPNGLATEVLRTFNTLASALAACTTGSAGDCGALFAAARPRGGARPSDTLAAAVAIARNPSQHAKAVFGVAGRAGDDGYGPALSAPPGSWILALVFTGSGMNAPGRMAFDRDGNAWIGNNFQIPGTTAGRELSVLDPGGQPTLGSPRTGGGLRGAGWGTAIDGRGRIWIANFAGDSVSVFSPDGRALAPPGGYTQGGYSRPQGITADQRGNIWVANFGNDSVTLLPRGNPRAARNIRGGGISKPFGIQVDARGHVWVTNGAEDPRRGSVTELLPDGRPTARSPITGGGLASPQGLAVDSSGNKWVANLLSRSVTRILPDGRVSADSPLGLGSVEGGWGIAVDGADHVWVTGFLGANVTELCGVRARTCPPGGRTVGAKISPSRTGYESASMEHMTAVQIDATGNVWLANNWTLGSSFAEFVGGNGLVQLVGAATPVRTPLIGPPSRP